MTDKEILLASSLGYMPKVLKSNVITMIIFPITSFDKEMMALKIDNGGHSRIDFQFIEIEDKIIFQFIDSGQYFGFDISELHLNKVYFRHESGKGIAFEVLDIKPEGNFQQYLQ